MTRGVLIVGILGAIVWAFTIGYIVYQNDKEEDRETEQVRMIALQYAYDGCLDRNGLREKTITLYEAMIDLPLPDTEQWNTFRKLLRSEVIDLKPTDCLAIRDGGRR